MFFFFIASLSLILLYKSLPLKPHPPWENEVRLIISPLIWKNLSKSFKGMLLSTFSFSPTQLTMSLMKKKSGNSSKVENVETIGEISVLDLPDLVLECILERLPPDGLCSVAGVCTSLREKCTIDHLWNGHMKQKWGRVLGSAAFREWQWHISAKNKPEFSEGGKRLGLMRSLSLLWPLSLIRSTRRERKTSLPPHSVMAWYLALQTGKFWFPAQVFNRESGHVGFMLSCYDAELSYDSQTDTFRARYPPHGRRAVAIENGVTWDRLRQPPLDISPYDLYVSNCLSDLRPGDHIEIQWRRNKGFPYGWWYGVVGHLELCTRNNDCRCHGSESVVLEFKQYSEGSRWRCSTINRKDHREEGNEADGFYGGIRKLHAEVEISSWRRFWPVDVLE